ncbi:DUF7093 family protein [Halomarina litorea]|uniref:DUF7093 family protein n=1 Tax=Halomarina litorea TaxID=2961595 RepID=UPI0020C34138|nr:hypothetical protein [Halomarina sp. BCD28]
MAITCSLLGHDFGETEVEREREERGSEVVTSIREVTVCRRCGAERVLSENTEVTSIVAPEDAPVDVTADAPANREGTATSGAGAGPASASASASASDPESASASPDTGEDDALEDYDPEDDDAVILTDDPDQRDYGDWPSEPGQDYRPWDPDTLVHEDEEDDGPTVAEMLGEEDDVRVAGDGEDDGDVGAEVIEADGERVDPAAGPSSVPDGDYHCTVCGFAAEAENSSYRPGDSCPSCREGYLTATERNP